MGKINYFGPPEPITAQHQLDLFTSDVPVLDGWLKQRALKNSVYNASKTFVLHQDYRVVAYYCLATGSIEAHKVPGKIKRNMPNPIPVLVLGRLAVSNLLLSVLSDILSSAINQSNSLCNQLYRHRTL